MLYKTMLGGSGKIERGIGGEMTYLNGASALKKN